MRFRQTLSYRKQLTPRMLVKMLLDPLLIIVTLLCLAVHYGDYLDRNYILVSLLIFALAFPGSWPRHASISVEAVHIMSGWLMLASTLLFFGYVTQYLKIFPQELVIAWVLLTPFLMLVAHVTLRRLLSRTRVNTHELRKAVIVGASEIGLHLRTRIAEEPMPDIDLRGFFDDRSAERLNLGEHERGLLLGKLEGLADYVRYHAIDLIYVALPMASQPRIFNLLDDLKDTTTSIYFVPDIFIFDLIQARIDDVGGIPVVAVCETPFTGMNGFIKRASDIVLASLILLLISPLLLLLAMGVKLSSPGPVLFKQRRYGLDGQDIVVYKFRSMTVCEDGAAIAQATRNDKRVTPFGALLRKTSLDELPQFVNVLQGCMSIVGPRPHAVAHNEMYRKLIKGYMIRHKVKPGITGWAQVNGLRGETETVDKMEARIEYDLDYLRRWSLVFDLRIVLRTIHVILFDGKAY